MRLNILTCPPDTKINIAANSMRARNISSIIIVENNRALGIWTEADCRKINFSTEVDFNMAISELMSSPVLSVKKDLGVNELATKFRTHGVRHFIVIDENKQPLGIVSQSDVVKNQGLEHYLQAKLVASSYKKTIHLLPHKSRLNAVAAQMAEHQCSSALIYHKDLHQYGIITERDLLTLLATGKHSNESAWHYAKYPLKTIKVSCSLFSAYQQCIDNNIRHLAVCDDEENIIGTLSMDNIMFDIEASLR